MFDPNAYVIRYATDADNAALARIAAGRAPLAEPVLVGEIAGHPAAAISLSDGRTMTDTSPEATRVGVRLAMRARAIEAAREMPNVRDRMRQAFRHLAKPQLAVCPECGRTEHAPLQIAA